jgi:hypothetical protein
MEFTPKGYKFPPPEVLLKSMEQLVAEFPHVQLFRERLAMEQEVARDLAEEANIVRTQASEKSFFLRPFMRTQ